MFHKPKNVGTNAVIKYFTICHINVISINVRALIIMKGLFSIGNFYMSNYDQIQKDKHVSMHVCMSVCVCVYVCMCVCVYVCMCVGV